MEFRAGSPVSMGGPLAPFAADLRRELAGRGYSVRSAGELMRLAARLSSWLDSRSLTADDLTATVAEEFFQAQRADGCRRWLTSRSLAPLLECLLIAPADTASGIPVEGLLAQYRDYLRSERGLAAGTVSPVPAACRGVHLLGAGRADRGADHRVRHDLVPAAQREPGQDDGHRAAVATAFPARQRAPDDLAHGRGALGAGMEEGSPAAAAGRRQDRGGPGRV